MKPSPIVAPMIVSRLQSAIGVDPQGLDPARLRWIIEARCRHLKLEDPNAYPPYLESSETELDALIDAVVVQETRFFRDPVVFDHIRSTLMQLASATTGALNILSAPCGTGEEAYSLAATLELLGLPLARFTIDAFDISQSALAVAERGVYPSRSFAHLPPELQQALGRPEGNHWTIHKSLRERIRFSRRNLANPGELIADPRYDLILCRNLFIYLAPKSRAALAQTLATSLLPAGRLFLGTADRVEELASLFAPMRPAASFAFAHRPPTSVRAPEPSTPIRRILSKLRGGKGTTFAEGPALPQPAQQPQSQTRADDLLERALSHRQHGELVKAERRCRQALYLEPNLLPALELLQSLWDEHPNLRLRRALRDRILRHRVEPARPHPESKEHV